MWSDISTTMPMSFMLHQWRVVVSIDWQENIHPGTFIIACYKIVFVMSRIGFLHVKPVYINLCLQSLHP